MVGQNKASARLNPQIQFSPTLLYIIALIIICLAIIARTVPGPRTIDDAYITYRYARNILGGNGFVYNPGEQVLGTTTPLYTFLLVMIGKITGGPQAPFSEIALFINAIADGLTCLLLLDLGRRLGSTLGGIGAALVWAIAPFSVTFAIGGLETSVYVLLLAATMYAYIQRRFYLTALLGAFSLITRPDAVLLLGPIVFDRFLLILKSRKESTAHFDEIKWRNIIFEILIFLVPILLWISVSIYLFGNPIPNSIAAKSLAYRFPSSAALIRLLQHYATPFLAHQTFGNLWIGIGIILYPFLFIIGAKRSILKNKHIWPYVLYPWLYFIVFSIANPLIFRWYLTPPLSAYILFILIGIHQITVTIGAWLSKRLNQFPQHLTSLTWIYRSATIFFVVLLPLGFSLRNWKLTPDHGLDRPAPEMAWYKLELLYQQAALSLAPQIDHQTIVAAGDVGVLGFLTNARILDTVGLNSIESIEYYPLDSSSYVTNYAIPTDLILDKRPDYIVFLEVYGRKTLLSNLQFQNTYRLIDKLPTDIYGSDGMLIFTRKN